MWPGGPLTPPCTIVLDGAVYRMRDRPTPELLHAIGTGNWWALFPVGLHRRDAMRVLVRLWDRHDHLELEHAWKVATDLGARLAGAPHWWAAMRLCATALEHRMKFDGWCTAHGFDPYVEPLWRTTAAVYQMLREQRATDERKAAQLDDELFNQPLEGPMSVPRWTPEEEARAALAALRQAMPGELPRELTAEPAPAL